MSDKPNAEPEVIPAYGEAGPEAESMERAADQADPAGGDAVNASEKALPKDAHIQNHGSTETDIAGRINETAERTSAQTPD